MGHGRRNLEGGAFGVNMFKSGKGNGKEGADDKKA
jgi:hypothetical protein